MVEGPNCCEIAVGVYMVDENKNPHQIDFDLSDTVYLPPHAWSVDFDLDDQTVAKQYLTPIGFDGVEFGQTLLESSNVTLRAIGIPPSLSFGQANLKLASLYVQASGLDALRFGTPSIINFHKNVNVPGIYATLFQKPYIYNLKQFVSLNTRGINSATYGIAYFQGGVKYIGLNNRGFNAARYGSATVINTKADQYANLSGKGVTPPTIPSPNVSPRILYPNGILAWQFGKPLIQRNPSPKGFDTSSYGVAWVSHSPRYIQPDQVTAFLSGYPRIFDPTQKIGVTGANTVIAGGIFGDITIRNTRRILGVKSFDAHQSGDWSVVESNLRNIIYQGFNGQSFGSNAIQNKTPSIAPIGFNALRGLETAIGYRVREVRPSGFYQPKFGSHQLTKPPEIKPAGIYQNVFGTVFISNHTRSIYAGLGKESLVFGEHNVWFRYRNIQPNGFNAARYGTLRIEHGRRELLVQGTVHSIYGNQAWLSHGVRTLLPNSIAAPNIPIHKVGGTQHIQPLGYVATLFGSRIIPESQSIYPQGFTNPFGLAFIDLWKKYIKPTGFLTTGQEGGHRFGTAKFWNKRQYIVQFYDGDSGLVPPKWTGWTGIENRNKTIGAIGSNFARVAEPYIENKARLLLPFGIDAQSFGKPMIADRIRYLKLQGLESPYFSGWSAIYNAAPVVVPQGVNTQVFGIGGVINTRRYFNRIGNFESLLMGVPMIAPRVRTLSFEHRYTIAPPIIPLPIADLYTRYIEEVGRFDDHQAFGLPLLNIRWNRITTRWTHRDYFGYPILKNLTPELKQRGHNSEEFGNAFLRTQWRELLHKGSEVVVWGRTNIAFRDRTMSIHGFNALNIGDKLKVIKTGVPPYYPQYIWLDAVEIDGEQNNGHGISVPTGQVSRPVLKTNVIFASGFNAARYGENHHTQSNGIVMEYGISMPDFEQMPRVSLKNRVVSIDQGIPSTLAIGKPRLSPHTIYAVMEAPSQAVANNPGGSRHYVNSSNGTRSPGEVFGRATISLQHRTLRNIGLGNRSSYGIHRIELKRRYIDVKGIQAHRMGWHSVGDGTQFITQLASSVMSLFGNATLQKNEQLHRTVRPNGFNALGISSSNWISHFHRTVRPNSFDALRMGTRLSNDRPFMWQGLRVGELVKGNYGGFENQQFGQAWISLKIRELGVQGFDSFVMEYDYTQFDKRMRVSRKDLPKPSLSIQPVGIDALNTGVPNIKPAVHYIRPDGNADQFRKGAF